MNLGRTSDLYFFSFLSFLVLFYAVLSKLLFYSSFTSLIYFLMKQAREGMSPVWTRQWNVPSGRKWRSSPLET